MSLEAGRSPIEQQSYVRRLFALAGTRTGVLALTTVANLIVRTGSSMLLTRLLRPYDFGIVGIITSVFFMVNMVTDLGFEAFLVRHKRTDNDHFRNVIWTIHAKRGAALFLVVALGSPLIAWILGKPVVALPLAVTALTFLIGGLSSMSLVTALRRDKSRELSLLDFGVQIFHSAMGVILAVWLRSAWAIIFVMVMQSMVRCALSYILFPNSAQHPARDPAISREFFAFSRVILASSMLTLIIAQSDKIILARAFTLDQFGLYAIAVTIAVAPVGFAEMFARRVLFPVYAQTCREAPTDIGPTYYRAKRRAAMLYAVGCGGLVGSARLLIALLYDPRYLPAATFLSVLLVASALRLSTTAASELLTATGDMKRMLRINVVRLGWIAFTMPLGLILLGPFGVVVSIGTIEVPALLYSWLILGKIGVLDMREESLLLTLTAAGAAIGWIGAWEILRLAPHL